MTTAQSRFIALLTATWLLAGCSDAKPGGSGQVIARVNGQEISVHQLNRLIAQRGETTPAQRHEMTEHLIERELAVQQALADKLDRQPEVMLRLEEARRDALATAWAERQAENLTPPSQNDIARYYAEHPGLFADRKLYRLQELALPADAPQIEEMATRLQRGERLPELRTWLRRTGARFSDQNIVRPAEQLPIEAVERLLRVAPGGTVAFRSARALTVYQLESAEPLPVTRLAAEGVIRTYLVTQSRNQIIGNEIQRLRKSADVRLGDASPGH